MVEAAGESDALEPGRRVALVTGSARRIGARIVERMHARGLDVCVHYRHSVTDADQLAERLNAARPRSALAVAADLALHRDRRALVAEVLAHFGRLDVLVNNASSFYPTPLETATTEQARELFASNVESAFFMTQAAADSLRRHRGSIVNVTDIHAQRPKAGFALYSAVKAALASLTASLAHELGPQVRVNAVAPGAVIWPEAAGDDEQARRQRIIDDTALARAGDADDVAAAVVHLALDASFVTGQTLTVDGGRGLVL